VSNVVAMRPVTSPQTEPAVQLARFPIVHRRVRIEIGCMLCCRPAGTLVRIGEPGSPWRHVPLEGQPQIVGDWRRRRCDVCGGNLVESEIEIDTVREEAPFQDEGAPRRGRPPRWLVQQRERERQQREIAELMRPPVWLDTSQQLVMESLRDEAVGQ
jgi:hypothetical protein